MAAVLPHNHKAANWAVRGNAGNITPEEAANYELQRQKQRFASDMHGMFVPVTLMISHQARSYMQSEKSSQDRKRSLQKL